jgi:hypothetical protein
MQLQACILMLLPAAGMKLQVTLHPASAWAL